MTEIIDLELENKKSSNNDQMLQFTTVQELVYSRVSQFIDVDHEGRHHISPNNLNLFLSLQTDSSELEKALNPSMKKSSVTRSKIHKLIQRVKTHLCAKAKCSKV